MPIEDFPIVGSYNHQRVLPLDSERTVNCFTYIDSRAKNPLSLLGTSGLINANATFTGATLGFRKQFVFGNSMFNVIGNRVYLTNSSLVTSQIGTLLNTTSGFVGIDANTFQVIFVDGANGYIWDTTAQTFKIITDTNFPVNPIDVCYLDGFFVVAAGGTNAFQLSSFNQGMVWGGASNVFTASSATDQLTLTGTTNANFQTGIPFRVSNSGGALPTPLNNADTYYAIAVSATTVNPGIIKVATSYANAIAGTAIDLTTDGTGIQTITSLGQLQQGAITSHPGTIMGCRTLHRRLFLFSQNFTEVWENAGIGTNLPFRRNNSFLIEYGLASLASISVGFDMMIFLSNDKEGQGGVMQVNGTEPIPISTKALDFQLAQYAALNQVSDCVGFLVKENGIIFYRMNFTAANHTYVYDVTYSNPSSDESKLWHEEEMLNGDRHVTQTHAYFKGINYVGHYQLPILYVLDVNTYTNNGEAIRRMRITAPITPPGYQRRRVDRLQIDFLQGDKAAMVQTFEDIYLLTEDNFELTTEDGNPLLLEQKRLVINPIQPAAFVSLSKDGGQTYLHRLRAPLGKTGDRTFRTVYRKLGTTKRGQAFVAKLEFFDPVPFAVMGASWFYEILPE